MGWSKLDGDLRRFARLRRAVEEALPFVNEGEEKSNLAAVLRDCGVERDERDDPLVKCPGPNCVARASKNNPPAGWRKEAFGGCGHGLVCPVHAEAWPVYTTEQCPDCSEIKVPDWDHPGEED